jgi:hypothetical protein
VEAWKTREPWLSVTELHAKDVLDAIRQLDVANTPRYKPFGKATYCNIYATDTLRLLGIKQPTHWHDPVLGGPAQVGRGAEMTANLLHHWMPEFGIERGWQLLTTPADALKAAQERRVCLGIWANKSGPGHVVVIRPDQANACAQAGRVCSSNLSLAKAFGEHLPAVKYWAI